MTIQLQKFSSKTIYYIQDVSFIVKGFTTKLFLQTLLNSIIYETFPIYNFYAYGTSLQWSCIVILPIWLYHCLKAYIYINNDLTVNNFLPKINYHHLTLYYQHWHYFIVRLLAVVIHLLLLNCSIIHQKQWWW